MFLGTKNGRKLTNNNTSCNSVQERKERLNAHQSVQRRSRKRDQGADQKKGIWEGVGTILSHFSRYLGGCSGNDDPLVISTTKLFYSTAPSKMPGL